MTVVGQPAAASYAWDNANRLTGITQGSASVSFAYDTANRKTTLTLPNGVTVAYTRVCEFIRNPGFFARQPRARMT